MKKENIVNPDSNRLGPGLNEAEIAGAIERSGYPLQNVVAEFCEGAQFRTVEEWSYVDRDTKQLRTIDVKAERPMFDIRSMAAQPRVRPALVLLIECKQSQMPYIFFLSRHAIHVSRFPVFAGLHQREIVLKTDDDLSTYTVGILEALSLESSPFLLEGPEFCTSFSKCARKGNELELSGSDPFLSLVSPLVKALQHFERAAQPPKTAQYFDLYLTLAVAVIDGPMIGVKVQKGSNEMTFLPWVRAVRHEYEESGEHWERGRAYAVDLIHKDFLETYIEKHAKSFAEQFSSLAVKHDEVLACGKGFASGMGKRPFTEMVNRIRPR